MVETPDKIPLPGLAGNGRVQRRIQDHLGLLKRRQLMKVAQELKEAHIPRQVGFAETPKHPQVWLEQGKQTLRPILVHVTPCVLFLGVIDERVHVALQGSIATRRVRIEPTTRVDREVGRLLY